MKPKPPYLAVRFLRWFCQGDYLEEIEGNLTELYEYHHQRSPQLAKIKFWWNVIRSLRPELMKSLKVGHRAKPLALFSHSLLITYRNFGRHRTSFMINLAGLSAGLFCTLLIYMWVSSELSIDKFHLNKDNLYQVMSNQHTVDGVATWDHSPVPLAPALLQEMPDLEYAVSSSGVQSFYSLSHDNEHFAAAGQFADENYFNIFSFEFLHGDRRNVLNDRSSIVISETMALKLFNTTENVLGKTVELQLFNFVNQYKVTGVFKDIPQQSSEQFDFVAPFVVFEGWLGQRAHWGNHNAKVYLVLKEGVDAVSFNDKIENFIGTKKEGGISQVTLLLQPYANTYLYNRYEGGNVAGGRIEYVQLFSLIAIFILVIACINFMNLSTAKASRRLKEVGIKKTVGADRLSLAIQYLWESLIISAMSLAVALVLVALFLPQFNAITGKQMSLIIDSYHLLGFVVIVVFTGLTAGIYPAIYLSSFSPAAILKGIRHTSISEVLMRKGLVVFQFTLSIILIVSVIVVYKQIELVQNKNLGYSRDNIIYFNVEGKVAGKVQTFLSEVKNVPGVVNASSMQGSIIGQTGVSQGFFDWEGKDPDTIIPFAYLNVNYDMLKLLGMEMQEGRSFSRQFSADTTKIIMNEAAIAVMGLEDPIGKVFNLWGNEMEIIGVVQDFHFRSLHETVKPLFFRLRPNDTARILVKISASSQKETLAGIQEFYRVANPGYSFDYNFLDVEYQTQYLSEQRVATLSNYFAGLAILISSLGLFGLAIFTTERRLKEMGVRKVLGASNFTIVRLFSDDFTKMVLIAVIIALPISYFLAESWLNAFAYRVALKWWFFAGAGLIALLIAWITVGYQSFRSAHVSATQCLRDD